MLTRVENCILTVGKYVEVVITSYFWYNPIRKGSSFVFGPRKNSHFLVYDFLVSAILCVETPTKYVLQIIYYLKKRNKCS